MLYGNRIGKERKHKYLLIKSMIILTVSDRSVLGNYIPHFCDWSLGHSGLCFSPHQAQVIYLWVWPETSFMIQEGLEFLSFLHQPPEGFSSFIILPGLSCYSFLLRTWSHQERPSSSVPPLQSSFFVMSGSIISNNTVTPFLVCCLKGHQEPQWPGESLSFQFNWIVVVLLVSPNRSIPSSGTKTSRLAEHKIARTES